MMLAERDMLPAKRPQWTKAECLLRLAQAGVSPNHPALIGCRGYYRDTMGVVGVNDRGIYDDAIALVSPRVFRVFNANVDPSREKPGVASLLAETVYWYRIGMHGITGDRPRRALVQVPHQVAVQRDGALEPTIDGVKLNIHDGGWTTTSSLGCQTIPPSQWREFLTAVEREMADHNEDRIPYLLIEGPVR
jgi:lysozyme